MRRNRRIQAVESPARRSLGEFFSRFDQLKREQRFEPSAYFVKRAHWRPGDEADLRCSHEARLELSFGKPKKPIALYGVIPYIRREAETM
jgi:hypothetical protein